MTRLRGSPGTTAEGKHMLRSSQAATATEGVCHFGGSLAFSSSSQFNTTTLPGVNGAIIGGSRIKATAADGLRSRDGIRTWCCRSLHDRRARLPLERFVVSAAKIAAQLGPAARVSDVNFPPPPPLNSLTALKFCCGAVRRPASPPNRSVRAPDAACRKLRVRA